LKYFPSQLEAGEAIIISPNEARNFFLMHLET